MATPCPACAQGPLTGPDRVEPAGGSGDGEDGAGGEDAPDRVGAGDDGAGEYTVSAVAGRGSGPLTVQLNATCGTCKRTWSLRFRLPLGTGVDPAGGLAAVNSTAEPSRIIDVAGWVMLFRLIIDRAGREPDKAASRQLGLEAAQCLDEALKFYDADNDLPPITSFFSDDARRRLTEHPRDFSRQRLIQMRARLPTLGAMRARALADATARAAASPPPRRSAWWKRLLGGGG